MHLSIFYFLEGVMACKYISVAAWSLIVEVLTFAVPSTTSWTVRML